MMITVMIERRLIKQFRPHQRHMAFSIAHHPSMKLLLHICMETKYPADRYRA